MIAWKWKPLAYARGSDSDSRHFCYVRQGFHYVSRTSRNRKEQRWPLSDDRMESGNRLLTRAALNLTPGISATLGNDFIA